MLTLLSGSTDQSSDFHLRKNFTYDHGTRTVSVGSGSGTVPGAVPLTSRMYTGSAGGATAPPAGQMFTSSVIPQNELIISNEDPDGNDIGAMLLALNAGDQLFLRPTSGTMVITLTRGATASTTLFGSGGNPNASLVRFTMEPANSLAAGTTYNFYTSNPLTTGQTRVGSIFDLPFNPPVNTDIRVTSPVPTTVWRNTSGVIVVLAEDVAGIVSSQNGANDRYRFNTNTSVSNWRGVGGTGTVAVGSNIYFNYNPTIHVVAAVLNPGVFATDSDINATVSTPGVLPSQIVAMDAPGDAVFYADPALPANQLAAGQYFWNGTTWAAGNSPGFTPPASTGTSIVMNTAEAETLLRSRQAISRGDFVEI